MSDALRIEPFGGDRAIALAPALAGIDSALIAELGTAYSHVPWRVEEFVKPLPGKWQHSFVAVDGAQPAGFWIAWARGADIHTSRVALIAGARGQGVGRRLFDAVLAAARQSHARRITLTVSTPNVVAQRFYAGLAFHRMRGACLDSFVRETGRQGRVDDDEIEEVIGGTRVRYTAWAFDVEG